MSDVFSHCRRILALVLPRLPTDRLHRSRRGACWLSNGASADAAPPLALTRRIGSAHRLAAVDAVAAARGLAVGGSVAEARARVPDLELGERDPEGEAETLAAIAEWCDRFTPLVGVDRDFDDVAGLFLDVTGVAHLFGGEAALAAAVVRGARRNGFTARAAIAGTPAAARAVARHGLGAERARVIAAGEERAAVAALPIAAIDPDPERRAGLARLGFESVGGLLEVPRGPIARRFGADLLARLDEAVGATDRPISPRRPVADLTAERAFFEPIVAVEDIAEVARSLAGRLVDGLEERGLGASLVELALWRVDGDVRRITVGMGRPTRDAETILGLFAERLKDPAEALRRRGGRGGDTGLRIAYGMDPGHGFDLVRLSVLASARLDAVEGMLSGEDRAEAAFDRLIDRLGARLGAARVLRRLPGESHLPEAASRSVPAASAAGRAAAASWRDRSTPAADEPPARPLRLLDRPEPIETVAALSDEPPLRFRWRRALYEVARAEGPERIAAEWWRSPLGAEPEAVAAFDPATATRDYFRVEDASGRRFWIFRAGLFERETTRPRWFLHGFFA